MERSSEDLDLGSSGNKSGSDGFIDRSKVRILVCDNESKSAEEVFTLLLKCSYQVTAVKSARQVIDALNADGPDIDIILAEVDLPMAKGMKMLKYIMRDKGLRRIPVIMMSAQDEVSTVVKCLRLGAADYLVKPLRTNELLNLWTHMWRRRRMLGLADKNIMNYEMELVASDPSDANTDSTTLFSDDTDDRSRKSANLESGMPTHQENDSTASAAVDAPSMEPQVTAEHPPDVPGISDRKTGQLSTGPKKTELQMGESSAFFTYVKSGPVKNATQVVVEVDDIAGKHSKMVEKQIRQSQAVSKAQQHENGTSRENNSPGDDFRSSNNSVSGSLSVERSCTPPGQTEFPQQKKFMEDKFCQVIPHPTNERRFDNPGLPAQDAYPYYIPGVMNQVMMPPASAQMYHLHELQNHLASAMHPQYSHLHQCHPHVAGMPPFPYYPVGLCVQPGQISTGHHAWSSMGGPSSAEVKSGKLNRREAALMKFRQKRKERCFDKKIRYMNRKHLAERRPRVRGQFMGKVNGVNVDFNGQSTADYDDDEEQDEEHASRDSSPDNYTTGY